MSCALDVDACDGSQFAGMCLQHTLAFLLFCEGVEWCMQDGTSERTASSEDLVAVSRRPLACNSKGEAMDVLMYSRLCSYAALGLCVTCGAPRVFQLLGIERSQ